MKIHVFDHSESSSSYIKYRPDHYRTDDRPFYNVHKSANYKLVDLTKYE
jgi:hypothetical protein